jgi:hypothetical protein
MVTRDHVRGTGTYKTSIPDYYCLLQHVDFIIFTPCQRRVKTWVLAQRALYTGHSTPDKINCSKALHIRFLLLPNPTMDSNQFRDAAKGAIDESEFPQVAYSCKCNMN